MWSYNKLIFNNKFVTVLVPDLGLNIKKPSVPFFIIINLATEQVRAILNDLSNIWLDEFQEDFFLPQNIFPLILFPVPSV